jgi:hypothetical protein
MVSPSWLGFSVVNTSPGIVPVIIRIYGCGHCRERPLRMNGTTNNDKNPKRLVERLGERNHPMKDTSFL